MRVSVVTDAIRLPRWRSRLASPPVRILGGALLLIALLAIILQLTLRLEYAAEANDILDDANRRAQKLAARTTEVLDRVDQTTGLIKYLRETASPVSLQSLRTGGVLANDFAELILVSGASGQVLESSSDQLPPSVADAQFYQRLRQLPMGEVDIAPVEAQTLLGGPAMPLSRRIRSVTGDYAGGVTVLVPPALLIASRIGGETVGTAYSVVGLDGVLRARLLDGRVTYGEKFDVSRVRQLTDTMRRSGLPVVSRIDGVKRFLAAVPVDRYPLLAVVALDADMALAGYQRTRNKLLLWAAGIAVLLLIGTVAVLGQAQRLAHSRQRQQAAARELAEQHSFLQSLLDFLPVAVYAKSMNAASMGRYLFWNRAAERTFHLAAERVVGQTVVDLFSAEQAATFQAQDAQIVASGLPERFAEQPFDGPDGRRFIDAVKLPVRGADGHIDHLLVIAEDITERRAVAERLRLAARVLAETADAVVLSDADDRIIEVNPAFLALSGHADAAALLLQPAHSAGLPVLEVAEGAQRWVGEAQLQCAAGTSLDIWLSASRIFDAAGVLTHHARVFHDISQLKGHQRELAALARRDALTGLPNRRHFDERLAEALARAARAGEPLALLFIDLDGFKTINDERGHEAGDAVLVTVAQRLRDCVRSTDLVSRLGGDEFTVVLEDAGSLDDVQSLCQRVVDSLSLPHQLGAASAQATPSVGLAMSLPDELPDSLLRRADDAMYAAKRAGKGRYAVAPGLPLDLAA